MRKRAIAKIIVCSIVGLILTAILLGATSPALARSLTGIPGRIVRFINEDSLVKKAVDTTERAFKRLPVPKLHFIGCAPVITFSENDTSALPSSGTVKSGYTLGNTSYEGQADSVSIDWAAGRIVLFVHDQEDGIYLYEYHGTDEPVFSTELKENEFSQNEQMMHRFSNGALKIEEFPEDTIWPNGKSVVKTLVVMLPKSVIRKVQIDAAAASIDLIGMEVGELNLNCASGKIKVTDSTIKEVDIDCAAATGEFLACTLGSIDLDSAGANLSFELLNTPDKIEIDGMSGSYRIGLPSDASFAVKADSLAGSVSINGFKVEREGERTIVNGGSSKFNFSLMSGSVTIEAAAPSSEEPLSDR